MSDQALMVMENSYPRGLRTLVSRLVGFSCNTFRVEPQGANADAISGSKISFSLPSNALLNLRSITLCLPWVYTSYADNDGATAGIAGVLPRASDLFEQVNIFVNGVAITNSVQQFNTLTRLIALQDDNLQRNYTSGTLEGHDVQSKVLVPYGLAVKHGQSRAMCWNNILGLLSNSSTRYLDCSLFGDLRIEFVVATNNVLMGVNVAESEDCTTLLPADVAKPTFTLKKFHMTCEAIQVSNGLYSEMQRAKIAQQEFISINYRDFYTLEADGGSQNSNTTRFSASSQCVNQLVATMRQSNYSQGIPTGATPGYGSWILPQGPVTTAAQTTIAHDGSFKNACVPHYFAFRSFVQETGNPATFGPGNGAAGPWPTNGPGTPPYLPSYYYSTENPLPNNWSVQFRTNGIARPQVPSDESEAWRDACLMSNKLKWNTPGNGIFSSWDYRYGQYISCCRLAMEPDTHSDMECARLTGWDSRNINSDFQVLHQGLQGAAAGPPAVYGDKSVFVVVDCTATIRCGQGKSIARIP